MPLSSSPITLGQESCSNAEFFHFDATDAIPTTFLIVHGFLSKIK